MKKLKGILVLVLLLALIASPIAVLASDISGARYYGTIIVSNNSTATTNVAVNCTISTSALIDGGYLNSSANNCVVRSSAGADLPFMPSVNATYPWCIWVPSIGENAATSDILYTANSTGGEIRYFPTAAGMTATDSPSMELGDNFTIEQSGRVDTSSGDGKFLIDKPGAFRTTISATENITSLIAGDAWAQAAPQLGAETTILSMAVFNGKIYGGTNVNGQLLEWNGVNAWVLKAPKLNAETDINALAVYDDKLYGVTAPNGNLYEWNGVNAWVQKAPKLGAETWLFSLAVYDDKLYAGTNPNGKLYEWNGVNLWVEVAPKLGAETFIYSLAVYNDKLYGGTGSLTGELYEWNGTNLWVQKAPQLGAEAQIFSLKVYNDKLYGGTNPNGKLYEWNGVDAWVEVAPKLGAEVSIYSLTVYNGKLYGGTGSLTGELYEWNGVDAWVQVAPQLGAEVRIHSLAVLNDKIYGGTGLTTGELYEWDSVSVTAPGISIGEHIPTTIADSTFFYIEHGTYTWDNYAPAKADLVLNAPLWHEESSTSPFTTKDVNEHTCTVTTATWDSDTGYNFDGTNDDISCGNDNSLDFTSENFTLIAWVRLSELTSHKAIITRGVENASGYSFRIPNNEKLWLETAQAGVRQSNATAADVVAVNTWYHLVAVRDGTLAVFYKNGADVPLDTVEAIINPKSNANNFVIGDEAGIAFDWAGDIGEVRAYDRALTPAEVLSDYNATKWKYDGSGEYFYYQLVGTGVPNNANDWNYYRNLDDYWEYTEVSVNGTQVQYIDWEYDDTTFQDSSGFDNDATPTFRTGTSDPDVSAVLTSFLPVAEAQAPAYTLEDAPAFIETVPDIVSEWDVVPPAGTFPLAGVIAAVASATDTPAQLPLLIIAAFVIIGFSLAVSATMRREGSGSLIVKSLVITALMGIFIAIGNFGIDFWMLFVFLVIAIALSMGSKQVGWQ